jgi:hypothetical protein
LLRVKQNDAPAWGTQLPHLLIEADNDLAFIGYELTAQAIDVGLAGATLVRRSLILSNGWDRSKR